jgi:hypothetical protein
MPHREERSYTIELNLLAEFPDAYAGEEDGFEWYQHFEAELRPRLVAAIAEVLRRDPHFSAVAAPRGRDPERALELELRFKTD